MYYAFSFPVGEPLYPFPQTHNREVRLIQLQLGRYKSNFPPKWKSQRGTLTGEASPQYFYAPEAPARIRKDFPDMRFIVSLRDPRRRAWSLYHLYAQERDKRDYARDREESGSFIEALEKEKRHEDAGLPMLLSGLRPTQLYRCLNVDGKTGKTGNADNKFPYDGHYGYLSTCYYAYWLKHWFKFFDRSRFLIIQAETLFADPDEVIQRVHKFLGLDVEPLNSTGKRDTTPVSYSPPPPDVEQLLTDYFKEPNRELFELLGEEFNWA